MIDLIFKVGKRHSGSDVRWKGIQTPTICANLCLLPLRKKVRVIDFPKKTISDQSKIFNTSLPNFMEFHQRRRKESHCQLCLLCSFSFERAQST